MTRAVGALSPFSAATVYEASGSACALSPSIKPLADTWKVVGRAFTVETGPGSNLWLHRAIYAADPGDVLVVSTSGSPEFGYWGEIMSTAAAMRQLGGLVIDGCVRDVLELRSIGFPVFASGLCVRGTGKDDSVGGVGVAVECGGLPVNTGDVVVADADGVVVVPAQAAGETAGAAELRDLREAEIIRRLRQGATTLELFGWA